jgi:hypothetical protein
MSAAIRALRAAFVASGCEMATPPRKPWSPEEIARACHREVDPFLKTERWFTPEIAWMTGRNGALNWDHYYLGILRGEGAPYIVAKTSLDGISIDVVDSDGHHLPTQFLDYEIDAYRSKQTICISPSAAIWSRARQGGGLLLRLYGRAGRHVDLFVRPGVIEGFYMRLASEGLVASSRPLLQTTSLPMSR